MQGWSAPPQESTQAAATMSPTPEHSVLTPADFRKILIKRKWIIILGVVLGLGLAILYVVMTVPQFEAVARVHVDLSRSANIGIEDLIQQQLSGGGNSSEKLLTEVQIMQSETVAMEVINSQTLYNKKPFSRLFELKPYTGMLNPLQRFQMLAAFRGSTKVEVLPNTEMVEIRFRNPDPQVAMNVANGIVDAYLDRDLRSKFEGTTRVSNWLSQQLNTVKKQVEDSQKDLAKYQKDNNLVAMDSEGGNLVTDSLRTVNQQLAEAEADRIVKEARFRMAQTRNPDLLVSVAPGTVLGSLDRKSVV